MELTVLSLLGYFGGTKEDEEDKKEKKKNRKETEKNRTEHNRAEYYVAGGWNSVYCVLCDFLLEKVMLGYFTTTRESIFWSCSVTLVEATSGNERD